jgi:hypothetical protein
MGIGGVIFMKKKWHSNVAVVGQGLVENDVKV